MKKAFVLFAMIVAFSAVFHPASAQIVKKVTVAKDSTVNTDTTYISLALNNSTKSVEFSATKVSGIVAGKAYLLGTVDGINWDKIDSVIYANQAVNYKVFPIYHLIYGQYQFQAIGSGTNKIRPIVGYIHRRE